MLQLKNIVKTYTTGELTQHALENVSITFRENEFVSILGPSGSGKTTLLNIIGGLDRYTSGDLVINGISTKKYRDEDWDYYRNSSIGFVFQSYNLIPHQSVLANVELALTLAGVSRKERRSHALAVLERVGLREHVHKKPNQMSGGQMQRVAIARALVNNPDILLADEPTGALDSETSLQIMELLKEIARDKLVIMVTHNPELASAYSTRIVKLLDGQIISDTDPCEITEDPVKPRKHKKISLSRGTALSLSFNNLLTKKGRTLLTAFAGSIGIIGIALILSLSTGIQSYINEIQRDTLSSYPISIPETESSFGNMMSASMGQNDPSAEAPEKQPDTVYSNDRMYALFNAAFTGEDVVNNLTDFKAFLEREVDPETAQTELSNFISTIRYQYPVSLNTYVQLPDGSYRSTELSTALTETDDSADDPMTSMMGSRMGMMNLWSELPPGLGDDKIADMVYDQYDLLAGKWPEGANEVVLILDDHGEITDVAFYALGLMEDETVNELITAVMKQEEISIPRHTVSYEDVLATSFKLVLDCEYYSKTASGTWRDIRGDKASFDMVLKNGFELSIVGIIQPMEEASATAVSGTFGYTTALTEYVLAKTGESEIVKTQLLPENENFDVITGLPFVITEDMDPTDAEKAEKILAYFLLIDDVTKANIYTDIISTPDEAYLEQMVAGVMTQYQNREDMIALIAEAFDLEPSAAEGYLSGYSDQELQDLMRDQMEALIREKYAEQAQAQVLQIKASVSTPDDIFGAKGYAAVAAAFDALVGGITDEAVLAKFYDTYMPERISGSTLAERLESLGAEKPETPSAIHIYAKTFEDKEAIDNIIKAYNESVAEEDRIVYTDYVALLMSGVTTMVDAVSYGLIAFVSISLVVSSIMIGIITYISVLERTKEIGILRSVGASKKDISRVFNAETIIVGLAAGLIGIGVTVLLNYPACILLEKLTNISDIAKLPWQAAVILVLISVGLTLIAGLIPSRVAANKDPVIALRTE